MLPGDRRKIPSDRRRGPRTRLVASVRDPSGPRLFLSQDLGPQGMSVLRPEADILQVRSPVCVEFELPDGHPVRAFARVAHDHPEGRFRKAGLEFVRLDGEQVGLIVSFVAEHYTPTEAGPDNLPPDDDPPSPAAIPRPSPVGSPAFVDSDTSADCCVRPYPFAERK